MSIAKLKEALKLYSLHDLYVRLAGKSRSELNYIATKLAVINLPRLIKRSLINLPTSLEEPHIGHRKNLIDAIRKLYYSGLDESTYNYLIDLTKKQNKGLMIDPTASLFYSDIYQLPSCFSIIFKEPMPPRGFDNQLTNTLKIMKDTIEKNESKLCRMLYFYKSETDLVDDKTLAAISGQNAVPLQLSSEQKDKIFEPFGFDADKTSLQGLEMLPQVVMQLSRALELNNVQFDYTVVRGNLFYVEFLVGDTLFGCGLDSSHQNAARRLARMALLNPLFEEFLSPVLIKNKNHLKSTFHRYKSICSEKVITA